MLPAEVLDDAGPRARTPICGYDAWENSINGYRSDRLGKAGALCQKTFGERTALRIAYDSGKIIINEKTHRDVPRSCVDVCV